MRRFWGAFLGLVMIAGLILAVWPLGQTIYGQWSQHALASEWEQQKTAPSRVSTAKKPLKKGKRLVAVAANDDAPATPALKIRKKAPWPLTKLTIPDIGLETFVVQGMDAASLRRGPGHDPNSAAPGSGNCVVAGHRNVYGSFFYRLDELLPGSSIILENRNGKFTYMVSSIFTTPDTNLTVLNPAARDAPPLLTPHHLHPASQQQPHHCAS